MFCYILKDLRYDSRFATLPIPILNRFASEFRPYLLLDYYGNSSYYNI